MNSISIVLLKTVRHFDGFRLVFWEEYMRKCLSRMMGRSVSGSYSLKIAKWILPWEIMFLMLWKVAKKLVRNKGRILRFFERWAETSCFQWRIRTTREVGETGKNEPSGRVMKNKSLRIVKPEGSFLTI